MIEVDLKIPNGVNTTVVQIVEQTCLAHGLICTLKGTLASYPDCIHWHFKKGSQKGVLEITWWEKESRLWFKVAGNRMDQRKHPHIEATNREITRLDYKARSSDRASS